MRVRSATWSRSAASGSDMVFTSTTDRGSRPRDAVWAIVPIVRAGAVADHGAERGWSEMMLRVTATVLSACLCLTPGPLRSHPSGPDPAVSGRHDAGLIRPAPPLCLAAAPRWTGLRAPCPVMPVDPFESVGARLWLLHVR